jgi:hypothetical protein
MQTVTREMYVQAVAGLALARLGDVDRLALRGVKLTYGSGLGQGARGFTCLGAWKGEGPAPAHAFIEICAAGEDGGPGGWVQIAGTTLHELGHALAPAGTGHGPGWAEACARLGLRRMKAAGTQYCLALFAPGLRQEIAALPRPNDGAWAWAGAAQRPSGPRPCAAGQGTRGGRSRGAGSGSRLRLYHCQCQPPVKVRCSAPGGLRAHCDVCRGAFAPAGEA